jgi:hypothetical protein
MERRFVFGWIYLLLPAFGFRDCRKPLLSANYLVDLHLTNIPHSEYISHEAMVTCLSVLATSKKFSVYSESPPSHPDRESRDLPPLARSVLSHSHYFLVQIDFNAPQLVQYVRRTPTLKAPDEAYVVYHSHAAWVKSVTEG